MSFFIHKDLHPDLEDDLDHFMMGPDEGFLMCLEYGYSINEATYIAMKKYGSPPSQTTIDWEQKYKKEKEKKEKAKALKKKEEVSKKDEKKKSPPGDKKQDGKQEE